MMILVTGSAGQLGGDVCAELKRRGLPFIPTDYKELDITDEKQAERFFLENKIDCVINCAAYTAVDKAETDREKCMAINRDGCRSLAKYSKKAGAEIISVSTDYVFNKPGEDFIEADETPAPINFYGRSKLEGEKEIISLNEKHYIVRTSWLYGNKNTNFVHTMLKLAESRDSVTVVADQYGSPTYSPHLAKLLCGMAGSGKYGVFHATNEGVCSWADLAEETFRLTGTKCEVKRCTTAEYPTAAKRPLNSRLSKKSLDDAGFDRLPEWREGLKEYLAKRQ